MNTTPANRPKRLAKSATAVPSHSLSGFKSGKLVITNAVAEAADRLAMSKADIRGALAGLRPAHFYKSEPSVAVPGQMMDVYHLPHDGRTIYVKFHCDSNDVYVLTSFKEK